MPTGSEPVSTPPPEADPFRCEISHDHDGARIRPVGELDVATAPLLTAELDALRDAGHRHLIVDLGRLSFIDSSGLRCILACDAEARNDGFSIALVPGSPGVQRVFQLTNTEVHLPFIGS